ncbi:MAG: bamB 5, partial [Phycisphaerales bacterium]|nr:bamB 5 [Phycisphaerales bacterium]
MNHSIRLTLSRAALLAALLIGYTTAQSAEPNSPIGWRGDGSGLYADGQPPTTWSSKTNIRWRTKVGESSSSPLIVGDKILLMSEPGKLLCLERATGRPVWEQSSGFADLPPNIRPAKVPRYETSCGYTTPTPVCDANNVYVVLGNGIVASYTLAGERNWIVWVPAEQTTAYGRSASPVLAGDVLIAPASHLHGLDRKTGKVLWEAQDVETAYGTPVVMNLSKTPVVVTPTGFAVRASDGKVLAKDLGHLEYASPIADQDTVYFVGPELTAVKLALAGDKLQVKRLFDETLDGEFIASPVLKDGLLFTLTSGAVYSVIDAKTGKSLSEPKTLELPPAGETKPGGPAAYPSPAFAGGMLYLTNTAGDCLVIAAKGAYEKISRNQLPKGSSACPVFAGKQLFLRG